MSVIYTQYILYKIHWGQYIGCQLGVSRTGNWESNGEEDPAPHQFDPMHSREVSISLHGTPKVSIPAYSTSYMYIYIIQSTLYTLPGVFNPAYKPPGIGKIRLKPVKISLLNYSSNYFIKYRPTWSRAVFDLSGGGGVNPPGASQPPSLYRPHEKIAKKGKNTLLTPGFSTNRVLIKRLHS